MPTDLSPLAYQTLQTMPALRGLGAAEREQVVALFHEQSMPKGTIVFREGESGTTLYIIVAGEVAVRSGGRIVAHLRAGEWFGEMSLLTGAARSATVEVVLDCCLLALDADAFSRLLAMQPGLYEDMVGILSRRLSRTSRGESLRREYETVFVDNRARWEERSTLVTTLAACLEHELGRHVAIVSVTPRAAGPLAAPREGRPDVVLTAEDDRGAGLRERLAEHLAALWTEVPLALVEIDEALPAGGRDLFSLADTVLELASPGPCEGEHAATADPEAQRRILLYDRRLGPTPPLVSGASGVLPREPSRRRGAVERLARCLTRRTVGVALGSGTAYGLAHVGVLAVLEEAGVPIDFVAGSSMGSIIGAGYALGMSPTELREMAVGFGKLTGLLRMAPSLLGLVVDTGFLPGLPGGDRFVRFLESFGPVRDATFADLHIPFRGVATDIETGARVEITDGKLSHAMRASCSVPWFLPPYRIGDRLLIDGGTADPVPSETVRSMGADIVIAVNAVPPADPRAKSPLTLLFRALDWLNPLAYLDRRPPTLNSLDVAMRSLLILQHALGNARAGEADVLINPALQQFWVLEFWSAPGLIEKGAEAAREALPAIRDKLRARPGAEHRSAGDAGGVPQLDLRSGGRRAAARHVPL